MLYLRSLCRLLCYSSCSLLLPSSADAAGAIVDGASITRIEQNNKNKLSAKETLRNHDAYNFFDSDGDNSFIRTGATGTNVADVCITLVH